jgi:hypothetical protein
MSDFTALLLFLLLDPVNFFTDRAASIDPH